MTVNVESDFRRILEGEVQEFVNATKALGSEIMDTMATMVMHAFGSEHVLICEGIARKQPADDKELKLITEPTYSTLRKIQAFRDSNRHVQEYSNHMATIAESVAALSWITYPKTPIQFIRDMKEAGDYYGNRVLIANKGNELHITWINKWIAVLTALEEYVKNYHRTGFSWGSHQTAGGVSVPTSFQAPAPPPPPPPPHCIEVCDETSGLEADRQQLLRQINQGIEIVNILKPVSKTGPVKSATSPPAKPAASPTAQSAGARFAQKGAVSSPSRPPVFALEGKKWRVEYQANGRPMELTPNDKSESLAMFKCDNIMFETKEKMNAVTIDNCKKSQILLQSIISSVELIRCERVEIHCAGSCPNITLDNCDSVSIFLGDASINCEIITAKCTSTNVCRITKYGESVEYPVPEQIRCVLVNEKLKTSVVEHM